MLQAFKIFPSYLKDSKISFKNQLFKNIVEKYHFFIINNNFEKETETDNEMIQIIYRNINDSRLIVIDQSLKLNKETNTQNYIVCFEQSLIILQQSTASIKFLQSILSNNPNLPVYFLKNTKTLIETMIKQKISNPETNENFIYDITCLKSSLSIHNVSKIMIEMWSSVSSSISHYLIKKSYLMRNKYRISQFIKYLEKKSTLNSINQDEFVELNVAGKGSSSSCILHYHIRSGKLCVIKKPHGSNIEADKLLQRETDNYTNIRHPFLPNFYGTVKNKNKNYIVIEFINGKTLNDIKENELNYNDRIKIIFELMIIFNYFHDNGYIYRDLKPDNVMIDDNKNIVLIDLDRLIKNNDDCEHTLDLGSKFSAPEVFQAGQFSYSSDIYSLGKMMEYLMSQTTKSDEISKIEGIYTKCLNECHSNRPSISEIITKFNSIFQTKMQIEHLFANFKEHFNNFELISVTISLIHIDQNHAEAQFGLGLIYYEDQFVTRDINKAIHYFTLASNQNHAEAQFYLGGIYYEGKYVTRDINKSIYYYSLASKQNLTNAQFCLGLIYHKGEYVTRDINKAIHYYSLASNQNYAKAQFNLGGIYHEGEYVTRDINKAIHYLSLASNQNYAKAQFNLGFIYYEGQYVTRDINKAIHYYSLASNQNYAKAQFKLGLIYHEGKYITRDINKVIHYYSLASDQNHAEAQFKLGLIYHEGKYIARRINKAIHYYSLASNQNYANAQFNLGFIYHEGKYITRDINKAIHYYSLASNQNHAKAQFNLGFIYYEGKYVTRDISKAIHYYSLASNQNYASAQFKLGLIYGEGQYVTRDINKAIHYYSLASNQNHAHAQFKLGLIYHLGEYITRDINKAIHYYSLASNQNYANAQFNLGVIYHLNKYVTRDINKAIHYYSLASNQNHANAQFNLGLIYDEGKYITRDINKAIHYYSLASNQNHAGAQFKLGLIYYEGKYVTRDINKAIHYFSLASKQNFTNAQFGLGLIYYEGKYVTRDINKAIHYFSLASNLNDAKAQFYLGLIYHEGQYVTRDINKAIHYFSLASNLNDAGAQFYLGLIYHEGKYVTRDINKAIHYYSLASNQNHAKAQFNLGFIYYEGKYVTRDINKAIHYYSLASNQNLAKAQFSLGYIYYFEQYYQDIKKGIYYIMLASMSGNKDANFMHGFLLHKGKEVKRDMSEAIHYYKEASSFNNKYAKNNLGIIYRYGYDNVEGQAGNAIVYFEEAIRQKGDYLSMYNLAHIHIYDEKIQRDLDKAINLLIRSSSKFIPSTILLSLVLVKKFCFNIDAINREIKNITGITDTLIYQVCLNINEYGMLNRNNFEILYETYKKEYFLYDIKLKAISASDFEEMRKEKTKSEYPNAKDITSMFYEGFGLDI